jgi:hypothetical protein
MPSASHKLRAERRAELVAAFQGFGRRREDWPPRLRRHEVPAYLLQVHNVTLSSSRLTVLAAEGIGPPFAHWGRYPIYSLDDIDAWVIDRLAGRTP